MSRYHGHDRAFAGCFPLPLGPCPVGNLLVAAAGLGGSAGVAQGLGPVVEHHLLQVGGQQVGVEEGGEPADGASAVLVLAAGEGAEEFHEGVGGRAGRRGAGGGWGDRLPDGIADVGPSGVGEPVEAGLVLNASVLWTTRYIDAAVAQLQAEGNEIREEDIARLSRLKHCNLNLLGRYSFTAIRPGALRPLHDPDAPELDEDEEGEE
ncbi:transposase [Streptomyces sp. NBC_00365]|nr:Tn3 family transposase [Streptomyces sp. NBC_00365]MCX5096077.1 transposase [Streptomyces sp. NBC_00365]